MSNSEIESPSIHGGDDDGDDDVCGGDCDADRKNQRGVVVRYKRDFRKAKRMIISRFRKKPQPQKQQSLLLPLLKNENYASSGSGSSVTSRRGKKMIGCCLCLKQPLTMESRFGSDFQPPDDPENPEVFTSECIKSLIENNDFYCKHCNPHIGFVSYSKD